MNPQALADELSALLATESRSLFRHLHEARPYLSTKTFRIWSELERIAHLSQEHAEKLSDLAEAFELPVKAQSFSTSVANYHYIDIGTLLPLLIQEKRSQIAAYERAVGHAADTPAIKTPLTQLLEDNRQQLASLEECQAQLAPAAQAAAR